MGHAFQMLGTRNGSDTMHARLPPSYLLLSSSHYIANIFLSMEPILNKQMRPLAWNTFAVTAMPILHMV